jgi:Protein of unknown function (DUF3037)
MPQNNLFEYAVVRIVPKVEREEFMNVGVVLYCAKEKFLQMQYCIPIEKFKAFCSNENIEEVQLYLKAFEQICMGNATESPIAQLPIASRFRWLTATRSTMVQVSKVHPGLCNNATAMLHKIFNEQVL